MSNCTNHEFYFMNNGCMPLRNKSMTLMRFCGFSHHGYRFFAVALNDALPSSSLQQQILHIRFGWRLTFPLLWRLTLPSLWRLFSNCHSERSQESLEGKMGNGIVAQSEESIAPNDTLPASSLRQQILHVCFRWRLTVSLIMTSCRSPVILNRGKNALWERQETE